ncbi:mitochondrial import translocase, subunit Tom22 [Rhizodiscina lignyota]|uniref:Mitochondrial import translocase, subunit Tom22 n=1 Tax=Rhizodiscina lignyota TaxID=1504668 RepID=A0A9P4MAA1_9PEZI|nr:mitochondrial import translocase, subunit Tom22 [Rhizodiscina lignyota]
MVKLEEVPDEELNRAQEGPTDGDEDWDTDSDVSDADSTASSTLADESLYDRIVALKDMLPPSQRRRLVSTVNTTYSWARGGLTWSGKALWVVSTSALLLGVPWALAYAEEQQMIEMEREMKMQQGAQDILTQPGATSQQQPQQANAAL